MIAFLDFFTWQTAFTGGSSWIFCKDYGQFGRVDDCAQNHEKHGGRRMIPANVFSSRLLLFVHVA